MDNLTHSLTGLLLGRAGLNRLHPHAHLLLFLSANAPDADAISILAGPASYFQYHRWMTHSIFLVPVIALLPVLAVRLLFWKRPFPWLRAWALSLIGVGSHVLLDWTNPYGIRLYLPFSDDWPGLHSTSVVDVWIWLILLIAVLWPMLSQLVGSEIGARSRPGAGWAIAGLSLFLCYDVGRWFLYQRAVSVQQARVYNGQEPRRAWAMPSHVNPFVWNGVVETDSLWVTQTVDLRREFPQSSIRIFYKPESSAPIQAARRTELFDTFLKFSKTPLWRVTPAGEIENGTRVEAMDLRFGFTATAILDGSLRIRSTSFHF